MTPTVEVSFVWFMVALAFAVGVLVQRWIGQGQRMVDRAAVRVALAIIADLSALARAGGRPLPVAIHRRIVHLRGEVGE